MATLAAACSPDEQSRLSTKHSPVHGDRATPTKRRKRMAKFVWRRRDAQDSRYYNLQLDINDARQQIQAMTQWRDMLRERALHRLAGHAETFVRTVREYFRVVRHGLHPAPRDVDVAVFLASILSPNVWVNAICGNVEMVIQQWGLYATCFAAIDLRCIDAVALPIHDLDGRAGYVVRARGDYSATLTPSAIAIMFPHVQQAPWIVDKLVGRRIQGLSHYDFVFDCQSRKILRCDMNMDLFGAFATLLTDLGELSFVFNGAKVESDFYLGDDLPLPTPDATPDGASHSHASKMDLEHILT